MAKKKPPQVRVWTDGACKRNPGPGAWAAVLIGPEGHEREISGYEPSTTNNAMEMRAVVEALDLIPSGTRVRVYSDSRYVVNGLTRWMDRWKRDGWKTRRETPVLNRRLWQQLDQERSRLQLTVEWVRGHAGDEGNERADALTQQALNAPHMA